MGTSLFYNALEDSFNKTVGDTTATDIANKVGQIFGDTVWDVMWDMFGQLLWNFANSFFFGLR